jgi:hypothetical protein
LYSALVHVLALESVRLEMRAAGLAAARRLTWDAAAQQMMQVMQHVVAR